MKEEKKAVDIKLAISAYISNDYITEDRVRLELYRRLSKASNKEALSPLKSLLKLKAFPETSKIPLSKVTSKSGWK